MKIHFTKKEYRLLLDIVSIAEWIMNSHNEEANPKTQPYDSLEQKILSYAKDFGFENLVTYDQQFQKYYPTLEYEESENARLFIDKYEEAFFWDELCRRLAQRDLVQEKGIQKVKEMDVVERLTAEDAIAERYNDEFIENGIKNFIISKS